jgi:PAS domain S-box-containing protein
MSESTDSRNNSDTMPELHAQAIFHNAPIGIFTFMPEGRIISANAALIRVFGYESPEELTASITDIATQLYADPADWEELMDILEAHGELFNHECQCRRRDGTKLWGAVNARAVRDEDGRIVVYQGFISDITEHKQAEEALRESQELLNATQQIARTGGWVWDEKLESMIWTDEAYRIHGMVLRFTPTDGCGCTPADTECLK